MPTENFVGELAVFTNKSKKEKVYASFHAWARILEDNNNSGHRQLMGRDLGWADILKLNFVTGYTLCPFSVNSGHLSVTDSHLFERYLQKKSSGMCSHNVISRHCFPESITTADSGWGLMVRGQTRQQESKYQSMPYEMFMAWFSWEIHFIRHCFE